MASQTLYLGQVGSVSTSLCLFTLLTGSLWIAYRLGPRNDIAETDYAGRAARVLKSTPLIDGHNDLPYLLRIELQNQINDGKFTFQEGLASHTDLKRMQKGRVGGQFWSVFMECPDTENIDDPSHVVRDTLEQIDVARRFIEMTPELKFCATSSDAVKAFKAGRIGSMLGAEGLHQTGSSIAVIRQLWDLGVRYITITHNCDNAYATAAATVTATGKDAGLSLFGAAAIREMNRLGMMVDLSHASHRTMRQVLEITRSPVIFSHSTCYSLARNYRNAPDDVIEALKSNGGVLMVMFVKRFLNAEDPEAANIETVVDHIMHIVDLAGWDHVGIGGDFEGTATLANGISSVADYPRLIEAVMRRGATDNQVKKLVGLNILRVWAANERNAKVLADELPVEEVWEGRSWSRWNNPLPNMIPGNPDRIPARDYQ
ncbi:dipeptidyl aminopeptidase [Talaromyces proteolyticus]|uniref:Dipeptidase n=1 Tax=Talaromyces proteolyticus TaxID=1131652 RepID=A0AAD4KZH2_9EURO|nr:dipeptidyl aminopeptidase [Talaromyces proteolyticus]KAH8700124.1 dipeptidyl aminopeptidase [Talaromyces proteolyticus]